MVRKIGEVKDKLWYICGACVVASLLAAGTLAYGASQAGEEPLRSAMAKANITAESVTLDLWGRFDSLAGDTARQRELADEIATGMVAESVEEVRAGCRQIRRSGQLGEGYMTLAVAENITPKGAGEVYLAVRLTGKMDELDALTLRSEQIMVIGENFGGNIAINTCLRGYISGKLKSTEKTAYLERLLASLGARAVKTDTHERYISCTAYTPRLAEGVRLSGENINLHIVFRDCGERMEVYLATPIVMAEY